jgi:serine/threonine protein kinase
MALQTAGDLLGTGSFGSVWDIEDVIKQKHENFKITEKSAITVECYYTGDDNRLCKQTFQYKNLKDKVVAKKFENKQDYILEKNVVTTLVQLKDPKQEFVGRNFIEINGYRLIGIESLNSLLYKKYATDAFDAFKKSYDHIMEANFFIVLENIDRLGHTTGMFLEKLHANNLCHLDIKPENILCDSKNLHMGECAFTVGDFGFVMSLDGSDHSGDQMGTYGYMSPYCSRNLLNIQQFKCELHKLLPNLPDLPDLPETIFGNWKIWMESQENTATVEYVANGRRLSDLYSLDISLLRLYYILLPFAHTRYAENGVSCRIEQYTMRLLGGPTQQQQQQQQQQSMGGSPTKSIIKYTPTNRTYIVRLDKVSNKKYICMKVENSTTGKRTEKVYLSAIKGKYKYKHVK